MTAAGYPIDDAELAELLAQHRPIGNREPLRQAVGGFTSSPEALSSWVQHAGARRVCVYARAQNAPAAVAKRARLLAARGLVTLRQGRHQPGSQLFDYMARRTDLPYAQARPAPSEAALSAEAKLLLDQLVRAADAGAPCPNNIDLAATVGVRTANHISTLLTTLTRANLVAVEIDRHGNARTIEILETGARTAAQ